LQKFTAFAYIKNIHGTVQQRTLTTDINDMVIENLHIFCSVTLFVFMDLPVPGLTLGTIMG